MNHIGQFEFERIINTQDPGKRKALATKWWGLYVRHAGTEYTFTKEEIERNNTAELQAEMLKKIEPSLYAHVTRVLAQYAAGLITVSPLPDGRITMRLGLQYLVSKVSEFDNAKATEPQGPPQ